MIEAGVDEAGRGPIAGPVFAAAVIFGIMGLNYTALLSIIVGVSVLIPYVGAFLATIPVVVVAFLQLLQMLSTVC